MHVHQQDICIGRYNVKLWKTFCDCFNCMHIAALKDDRILWMHGGRSPDLINLDQIKKIVKTMNVPERNYYVIFPGWTLMRRYHHE